MRPWIAFIMMTLALAGCAEESDPAESGDEAVFEEFQAEATDDTGIIRGVVFDPNIVPIEGAIIKIESESLETITNANGAFAFGDLEPRIYFLSISAAGFGSTQTSVDVQAGNNQPDVIKIRLDPDPTTQPFASPFTFESYMQCTESLLLVGYSGGCDNDFIVEYGLNDLGRTPDFAQSEMVWKSTQQLGDWMSLLYSRPEPGQTLLHNYVDVEGPSPLVASANKTTMEENGLLTADSNPGNEGCSGTLCIRIFNSGMEGTDIGRDYGDPTDGDNCVERPQLGGCTTGLGATIDQSVTVYTHAFFNFLPDEDWQFSVHGHPVPPS